MSEKFLKTYELKKKEDSGPEEDIYIFEGVASEYGVVDKSGEIIRSGAFDESIGKTIPVQIMHGGIATIIGAADIEQQGDKLIVKGQLYKEVPQAVAIAKSKSQGVKYNLSIGGRRTEWDWEQLEGNTYLVMKKGVINEVSFTGEDQQAHPNAKVTKTTKEEKNSMENVKLEELTNIMKTMAKKMDNFEEGKKSYTDLEKMQGEVKNTLEKFEGVQAENEDMKKTIDELKKTIECMDDVLNKSDFGQANITKTDNMKENDAFNKYLRDGNITEYKKAINTTGAGNLIPQLLASEIIKDLKEASPFFGDAKIYTGKRGEIDIPIRDSWTNAVEVVAEGSGVVTKGSLTYSLLNIKATKLQSEIQLTDEMREDTDFDMQAEIREANTEDFAETLSARIEGGVYATSGFEGFTVNTTLTGAALASETASTITADDMIDLEFELKTQYRMGAKYYASRDAMKEMKKFKDEQGQYLWQNPITQGTPPTFNGYPVVECPDMDDVEDAAYPVLFANMSKLYAIYLRKGMETELDRLASEGIWNHITRMRVGGKIRNSNAGVLLKVTSA